MSTELETLEVSVLPYRYSIAPSCCVCLGCCAATLEFRSSGGTYELPCVHIYIYIYSDNYLIKLVETIDVQCDPTAKIHAPLQEKISSRTQPK
jgi:hypothetical protein